MKFFIMEFSLSKVDWLSAGGLLSSRGRDFSLHHCLHTETGAHPTSCPMSTGGCLPWVEVSRVWS